MRKWEWKRQINSNYETSFDLADALPILILIEYKLHIALFWGKNWKALCRRKGCFWWRLSLPWSSPTGKEAASTAGNTRKQGLSWCKHTCVCVCSHPVSVKLDHSWLFTACCSELQLAGRQPDSLSWGQKHMKKLILLGEGLGFFGKILCWLWTHFMGSHQSKNISKQWPHSPHTC